MQLISICLYLSQICRYLFIEISYLECVLQTSRSSAPDNDLTAYASRATKGTGSSSPAPHFLRALQQRKSFNACTSPNSSLIITQVTVVCQDEGRGIQCLVFLCDAEFYTKLVGKVLVCTGTGPREGRKNAIIPLPSLMGAQRCYTCIFAVCLDLALEDLLH